jgi:hypothetical protein
MKTKKLGVMSIINFGNSPKTREMQESSVLRFALMFKSGAGILPALAMFSSAFLPGVAFAQVADNSQLQIAPTATQKTLLNRYSPLEKALKRVAEDKEDKENDKENATPVIPSSPIPQAQQTPAPTEFVTPSSSQTIADKKLQIEIAPVGDPRVQADGRSTIKFSGQVTDEKGELLAKDVMVTLTTSAGKFVGADQDKDAVGFQVRAINGEFTATLQSDIKPQQVKIRAAVESIRKPPTANNRVNTIPGESFPQQTDNSLLADRVDAAIEAYTQVEFTTYLRPSLVTGIVNFRLGPRGTDYWGSLSDFLRPRRRSDGSFELQDDYTAKLSAAVFATGRVGDWLFTGALNSDRPINQDCEGRNRLFGGIQFCEQNYPVYGDSSTFSSTTPSIDSFYARLEKTPSILGAEPDYVMWGDYNTNEFARESQLYTATARQLHGFKGNYNFGPIQLTALYANNIEGFQRDTFVPNGTSGNYFLAKRLLIPGSENVFLEMEEINRPGTVLDRTQLFRGRDYEIDYDRGTINFFRPILATELNPLGVSTVRRVVVTYQNEGGQGSNLIGGRLQYNISYNQEAKSYFAGSYLREDQGSTESELYGGDFLLSFGNVGQLMGEYARSSSSLLDGRNRDANAYRIEALTNLGQRLNGRAYYRAVEPNFLNNATSSFFPGQTRYGASVAVGVTDTTSFNVGYDVEENYGIAATGLINYIDLFDPQPTARSGEQVNNELRTFRAGILQKFGAADASVEYVNRERDDRVSNRFTGSAEQLVSRVNVPLGQALTFRAQNELNLGGDDPLYPNRTTLAMDWRAYPGVTFRLAHQFYDRSELLQGNSLTTFDTILDRKIGEDTTITGRYSVLSAYNGLQGQGAVGLDNRIRIAPGLKLNLGYQYVFKNIFGATATGDRFGQYYAVGQTASSLGLFSGSVYSLGLEYTDNPDFQASGRFEFRDGEEGNNTVISAAAAGKISPALTALVRYRQAGEANVYLPSSAGVNPNGVTFQELGDTSNLKIGLAYRDPNSDMFNGLLKYEYRQNFDSIVQSQEIGSTATGHVFSFEGIYAPSWRWEFYGKYALRNGVTFLDGDRYDGTVNLGQLRAAYRLGYRNDLAVEGRWIGQNTNTGTGYSEFGVAIETGYYVTPDLRLAVGYSLGGVDDRDFSGYRSQGGIYLNISLKLNELLGGFGLQKPVPKQQQESEVGPMANNPNNTSFINRQVRQVRQEEGREERDTGDVLGLIDRLRLGQQSNINLINRLRGSGGQEPRASVGSQVRRSQ